MSPSRTTYSPAGSGAREPGIRERRRRSRFRNSSSRKRWPAKASSSRIRHRRQSSTATMRTTRVDAIVRVEAARLRAKLTEYAGEGRRPVVQALPKGGYAALMRSMSGTGRNARDERRRRTVRYRARTRLRTTLPAASQARRRAFAWAAAPCSASPFLPSWCGRRRQRRCPSCGSPSCRSTRRFRHLQTCDARKKTSRLSSCVTGGSASSRARSTRRIRTWARPAKCLQRSLQMSSSSSPSRRRRARRGGDVP